MNHNNYAFKVLCSKCGLANRYTISTPITKYHCFNCNAIALELVSCISYVYILYNKSMPQIYKIGYTEAHPSQRAAELSRATGVPTKYIAVGYCETRDPQNDEKKIHDALKKFRVNLKREHFRVSLIEAVKAMQDVTKSKFYLHNKSEKSLDELEKTIWKNRILIVLKVGEMDCSTELSNPSHIYIRIKKLNLSPTKKDYP